MTNKISRDLSLDFCASLARTMARVMRLDTLPDPVMSSARVGISNVVSGATQELGDGMVRAVDEIIITF